MTDDDPVSSADTALALLARMVDRIETQADTLESFAREEYRDRQRGE